MCIYIYMIYMIYIYIYMIYIYDIYIYMYRGLRAYLDYVGGFLSIVVEYMPPKPYSTYSGPCITYPCAPPPRSPPPEKKPNESKTLPQRAQYPLITEYTLNHNIKAPII